MTPIVGRRMDIRDLHRWRQRLINNGFDPRQVNKSYPPGPVPLEQDLHLSQTPRRSRDAKLDHLRRHAHRGGWVAEWRARK